MPAGHRSSYACLSSCKFTFLWITGVETIMVSVAAPCNGDKRFRFEQVRLCVKQHFPGYQIESKRMTTFNISKKGSLILIFMLAFAVFSRGFFAYSIPFSGDEVGVGVLQATGQALSYEKSLPSGNVPISEIRKYIEYSADKGVRDVISSLRHAGMHPPFYYLLLHHTIQFLNNSVMTLRSLSLVFSVLSIALIFFLGKAIHSEFLGLLSALFVTLSAFCLQYSVMVRPYPLLMFLSMFSTLLIHLLVTSNKFSLKNFGCYLYIIASVVGLYTHYHYIFVILFQSVFVFLSVQKSVKRVLLITLIYLIIGLLFLPWLPSLNDQLNVINGGDYYFHGQNNLPVMAIEIVLSNFLRFAYQDNSLEFILSLAKIVPFTIVLAIVLFVFLMGCKNMLSNKQSRLVLIALLFYLAMHCAGDWIMHAKTLSAKKFQFFLTPMFFFILAFGFVNMSKRFFVRTGAILLFSILLILSSVVIFQAKINFDGPAIVKSINSEISNNFKNENGAALLIVNTSARRFLLSTVHAIKSPIDVTVLTGQDIPAALAKINDITQYDTVYVGNLLVNYEPKPRLTAKDLKLIKNFLERNQFNSTDLILNSEEGALMQFSKQSPTLRKSAQAKTPKFEKSGPSAVCGHYNTN